MKGIEIGALHVPTPVPEGVTVTYVDRDPEQVRAAHSDVTIAVKEWVVDDANFLREFALHTQDFLIAHHVLEHLENPIQAFFTWLSVVKPGGVLLVSLPDKTKCFDRPRPITRFEHLLADFNSSPEKRHALDLEHYIDWYLNSELESKPIDQAVKLAHQALFDRRNIHFHVWDKPAMVAMFDKIRQITNFPLFDVVKVVDWGGEVQFAILKKKAEELNEQLPV